MFDLKNAVFSDSSLPVGSFIFSHGLESKYTLGLIRDETHLKQFIKETCYNLLSTSWPFVVKTFFTLENSSDLLNDIKCIDLEIDSFYATNSVFFKSSKIAGHGYITCLLKSKIRQDEWLIEYKKNIISDQVSGNLPITFTIMGYYLDLSLKDLKFHMILSTVKNLVSAAVRLNIINAFSGLKMTLDFGSEITNLMSVNDFSKDLKDLEYFNTNPLLDIYQGRQEYLYSRLFHS